MMVLAFCNYLFLISVGLQPVLLLFSFGVVLLCSYFCRKAVFKNNIPLAMSVVIPAMFFAPIQLSIMRVAYRQQKFK